MRKTIMTVDDAATMRKMITFTLKSAGHDVLEASDGKEAYDVLSQRSVDLVITDVNMPNMNGIELVRSLRALPAHQKTPILMLTTESQPEMKQKGKEAGATGWIVKPFQQDQLLAVVARVLPNGNAG